jgi:3-oxoacyl-[acyl-carrier protein] reductase
VTGVSRREGIGWATVQRLANGGAEVFTQGWTAHDAGQPWGADEGFEAGGHAGHLDIDLAEPDAPARVVEAAVAAVGPLDVLVANHAASADQNLEQLTAEAIDHTLAVNVRATLLLVQAFAAAHAGGPGGRVILLTSGQGRGPMARELPYVASKAALSGLVASLADHLAPRGISVNAVNPGPTDTGWAPKEIVEQATAAMPRGRWGTPDDAARLIAWLASEESDWVTGQVIDSDGGFRYGGA